MNETSVTEEIHKLIDEKIDAGVVVHADWIAASILAIKDQIEGEDAPFYRVCAYRDVVRIAKRVIGKFKADDTTPEQLVLAGFEHLCKAYPMDRNGARCRSTLRSTTFLPSNLRTSASTATTRTRISPLPSRSSQ